MTETVARRLRSGQPARTLAPRAGQRQDVAVDGRLEAGRDHAPTALVLGRHLRGAVEVVVLPVGRGTCGRRSPPARPRSPGSRCDPRWRWSCRTRARRLRPLVRARRPSDHRLQDPPDARRGRRRHLGQPVESQARPRVPSTRAGRRRTRPPAGRRAARQVGGLRLADLARAQLQGLPDVVVQQRVPVSS